MIFGLTPLAFEEPVTCLGVTTVTLGRFMTGAEAPPELRLPTYEGPTLAPVESTPVDACPFAPFTDPSLLASLPATGTEEPDASTSPNLNAMDEVGEGSTELGVSGAGGETGGTLKWGGLPFDIIGGFIPSGGGLGLGLAIPA